MGESFLFGGGANVSASPQLAQAFGPLRFEHVPLVGAADTLVVPLGDELKDWRKKKEDLRKSSWCTSTLVSKKASNCIQPKCNCTRLS